MKNLILALAFLCAAASSARAGTTVMQVAYSSFTVGGVAISSFTGTDITGGKNSGWRQLCVQNYDTTNALYCGDSVNVSTSPNVSLALLGEYVPVAASGPAPVTPSCFIVVEGMSFFCRTASQSAATKAVVIKSK